MKHQVELTIKQILEWECPYNGCSHNIGGVCSHSFYMDTEQEYHDEEISLSTSTTCNHCDTDDEYCPCGSRLELKPDIDEGRIYGYNHECTNRKCPLR